ncbi:probable serine/threonine-protein kinase At1g54610 [Sorghum bicolor]|uniref:[RNA-polymerase]-subunit kinase n=1 Tax=Sorghum bicolor TaxID=4558 RepID=A0A1B6PDU3_SORBI|nr:probable serine/threonine-protein kinase At1g54610 [Sorghum bicolor]XP_021301911.1 probable serine/threonine-protein kinase At1g54610 [Sorghum bicolor]XP_021301912.1 probable serine/threonine-protein kinase At1g54610 [Sorghum bicolor]KXG23797.1 hypothetical protein SORBI_3008G141300 [Sorghum bicolor]KXG23798.1 hypothetical protein SORBI_3008G141300 [Sorghum bicolor]OQU79412.1 hypothetical protein SORBI_3008G141300 [Sorghum bicolor]|eukprot:XP_021301910.1 probable serine/threonine-protein kinase At1g54610 [Sorghum bicolor]
MGCAASRHGAVSSPSYDVSSCSYNMSRSASASADLGGSSSALSIWSRRPVRLEAFDNDADDNERRRRSGREAAAAAAAAVTATAVPTVRLGNVRRCLEGEQAAAGWPSWLSAVAAEAVHGWVPLRADSFEKLEKVGQGTYSSVFRARELATGRLVALKKVRFDSVEPESVRFMAREILILRRLRGHPNVVGLEGLITSRSSSSIYLVFEYLEHDLAGLNSSADITFTEPQIKCYMRQLLEGLAHCHARGVMHRDIKCANLLVSNGGELKVADFGLANLFTPASTAPLTSRVVTLWYRPPELLLGATAYEPTVDLWSAGCVFAEMHARRPVLQGRTEVEQIHKIFKLCGSPPDDFWRRSGISHAAVFRPQQPYPSRLRDTFAASMPDHAFRLLATLLSLDPAARGTAAAALDSEYFTTAPYACSPASLPKYAPNKEMDAKFREESRRRSNLRSQGGEAARRMSRGHKSMQLQDTNQSHVHAEESLPVVAENGAAVARNDGGESRLFVDLEPVPAISKRPDDGDHAAPCARTMSTSFKEPPRNADRVPLSGPVQLAASTGFAWAKKPRPDAAAVTKRSGSKETGANNNSNGGDGARTTSTTAAAAPAAAAAPYEVEKQEMIKQWAQVADAFSASEAYNSRFRQTLDAKQLKTGKMYKGKVNRVDYSGPLLSQPRRIDELLHNHEQQIRQAGRRSWFKKGSKKEQP